MNGGKRPGSGRQAHPLGVGVKTAVRIPLRLHDAIVDDAARDGVSFSQALVKRLIRGKPRGRKL